MSIQTATRETLGARRYDLDWVRIGAFILLIFYHVGMYYVTWDWHVKSPHASHTIEPLMMLTQPWRLSLLFLISGVATAYLVQQPKGRSWGFLKQRSIRLLVPLLFGMAVIVPPQSYLQVVEHLAYSGTYIDFLKQYFSAYHGFCQASDCLTLPTWNHLWFVAYLWVYTVALYAVIRVVPSSVRWLHHFAEDKLGGPAIVWIPIAFLAIARMGLMAYYPPTHDLIDDWYNHATYGMTFLLGFALAGTRAPWVTIEGTRWVALGLALLGWVLISTYVGSYADGGPAPPLTLRILMRGVYGTEQWVAIVAILGFAQRYLMRDNAARRYLTTAIFPVYILHQTVIIVVAHSLKPADLNPGLEGALLVLVTASLCLLGYEIIRRVRFLRPLFGLGVERTMNGQPLASEREWQAEASR